MTVLPCPGASPCTAPSPAAMPMAARSAIGPRSPSARSARKRPSPVSGRAVPDAAPGEPEGPSAAASAPAPPPRLHGDLHGALVERVGAVRIGRESPARRLVGQVGGEHDTLPACGDLPPSRPLVVVAVLEPDHHTPVRRHGDGRPEPALDAGRREAGLALGVGDGGGVGSERDAVAVDEQEHAGGQVAAPTVGVAVEPALLEGRDLGEIEHVVDLDGVGTDHEAGVVVDGEVAERVRRRRRREEHRRRDHADDRDERQARGARCPAAHRSPPSSERSVRSATGACRGSNRSSSSRARPSACAGPGVVAHGGGDHPGVEPDPGLVDPEGQRVRHGGVGLLVPSGGVQRPRECVVAVHVPPSGQLGPGHRHRPLGVAAVVGQEADEATVVDDLLQLGEPADELDGVVLLGGVVGAAERGVDVAERGEVIRSGHDRDRRLVRRGGGVEAALAGPDPSEDGEWPGRGRGVGHRRLGHGSGVVAVAAVEEVAGEQRLVEGQGAGPGAVPTRPSPRPARPARPPGPRRPGPRPVGPAWRARTRSDRPRRSGGSRRRRRRRGRPAPAGRRRGRPAPGRPRDRRRAGPRPTPRRRRTRAARMRRWRREPAGRRRRDAPTAPPPRSRGRGGRSRARRSPGPGPGGSGRGSCG